MTPVTLAVAQSLVASDLAGSVGDHVRLATLAAEHGARLVIFPELSLTGYDLGLTEDDALEPADPRLEPLREAADSAEIVVVAGAPVLSPRGLHIGALHLGPGRRVATYAKEHPHGDENRSFVPGDGGAPVSLGGELVAFAICADTMHPEHVARAVEGGATVYAASSFYTHACYDADAELLRSHARRHGVLVMMANLAGPVGDTSGAGGSAIWTGDGTRIACAPPDGEALVLARSTPEGWSGAVVIGSR